MPRIRLLIDTHEAASGSMAVGSGSYVQCFSVQSQANGLATVDNLEDLFRSFRSGRHVTSSLDIAQAPVQAFARLVVASGTADAGVKVNGQTISATGASPAAIASSLKELVNASTSSFFAVVTASLASSESYDGGNNRVVVVRAKEPGLAGNMFTFAAASSGSTADNARLMSGSDGQLFRFRF